MKAAEAFCHLWCWFQRKYLQYLDTRLLLVEIVPLLNRSDVGERMHLVRLVSFAKAAGVGVFAWPNVFYATALQS
ncbi:hypothetical protein RA210_U360009 [Rubrivivax sp. A210]|nr:hypothetical protein RA210_U360009 [Rubrivivax sp. A210]